MIIKYLLVAFIALVYSCSEAGVQESTEKQSSSLEITTPIQPIKNDSEKITGVLILHSDTAEMNKADYVLLNQNKSLFTKVVSINDNEPSSEKLQDKILAYYPDYYIIHFNAGELDSFYNVKVGSEIKLLKKGKYMEFLSWEDYVLRFFCTTNKENPLRKAPDETALVVNNFDYKELSFRCTEISGDWVRVTCNADCEGCPDGNKIVAGWIRWKKNGKVILKQYYTC